MGMAHSPTWPRHVVTVAWQACVTKLGARLPALRKSWSRPEGTGAAAAPWGASDRVFQRGSWG